MAYEFSEDYHEATQLFFEQIAKIRSLVPLNSVETLIDSVTWASSWRRSREATSSSISGFHFGHYIAGAESEYISNYHAVKTSLALMRGISLSLSRWQRGLACMLEKKAGSRLVTKLRSILLLEADLNKANKIIYGDRMMKNIRRYNLMPEEIFSVNVIAQRKMVLWQRFYSLILGGNFVLHLLLLRLMPATAMTELHMQLHL